MKKLILTILILLSSIWSYGQEVSVSELKKKLAIEKDDKDHISLCLKISFAYQNSNPDSAMAYAERGFKTAIITKSDSTIAACLNQKGNVYRVIDDYNSSLENFIRALKLYEQLKFKKTIASVSGNIGIVHNDLKDFRGALDYFFKAKKYQEALNDRPNLMLTMINIGDTYEKLDKMDSALIFTNYANQMAISLKDIRNIGVTENNLGDYNYKIGHFRLAKEFYNLAVGHYQKGSEIDIEGLSESNLQLAKIFKKENNGDSVLYYARLSFKYVQKGKFTAEIAEATKFLSEYFISVNNVDSAFYYQREFIVAQERLFSQEKSQLINKQIFEEKDRQLAIEIKQKLEEEQHRANLQKVGIAIFIICFFFFVLLISKTKLKPSIVEFLGILLLLLVFEFISDLLSPVIKRITNDTPVFALLMKLVVALLLIPVHKTSEIWLKKKLSHRPN